MIFTCREVTEFIFDYVDGSTEAEVRNRIEAHLGGCSHCAAYLQSYRLTIRVTKMLTVDSLPPEVGQRMLAALRNAEQGEASA